MAEPVAIPALDAIAADGKAAAGLPLEMTASLMQRCATVMAVLAAEQVAQAKAARCVISQPIADRTLDADEIAAALGTNRRWVFRNARKLPFLRRISASACWAARPDCGAGVTTRRLSGNLAILLYFVYEEAGDPAHGEDNGAAA